MIASAYARANESARTGPDAPKNDQTKQKSNQAKIESNYIDEPTDRPNEHSQDRSQKKDQAEATKERANKIAR